MSVETSSIPDDGSLLSRHLHSCPSERQFPLRSQTPDGRTSSSFLLQEQQHISPQRTFLRRPPTPPPRKHTSISGGKLDRSPALSEQGYQSKDRSDTFARFLLNGCSVEGGNLGGPLSGRFSRRAATPPAAWWGAGGTREDSESSDSSVSFYRQVAKGLSSKAKTSSSGPLRNKFKEERETAEKENSLLVGNVTALKPPSGNLHRRRAAVTKSLVIDDSRCWKNDWIDPRTPSSPSTSIKSSRSSYNDSRSMFEKVDCLGEESIAVQNEEELSAKDGSPEAEESFSSSSSNELAHSAVHLRKRTVLAKGRRSQCKSAHFPYPDQCAPWPPFGYHWMPPAECHSSYHGYCYKSWVNVMTEQVDILTDKVRELEGLLEEKKIHLSQTEDLLQQEMLSRSSVENSKLELMTDMSNLRLKVSVTEQDRKECEERCRRVESEVVLLQAHLAEKEAELASLRTKITYNGISSPPSELNTEVERLKKALESVMAANEEKDKKIEELRSALNKYKKLQDLVLSGQIRRVESSPRESPITHRVPSHDSLFPSSPGTENSKKLLSAEPKLLEKPPPFPRPLAPLLSTPVSSEASPCPWREGSISRYSPSPCSAASDISPFPKSISPVCRANSAENVSSSQEKASPPRSQFGTLPWQHGAKVLQQLHQQLQQQESQPPLTPSATLHSDEVTPPADGAKTPSQQQPSHSFQNLNHPSLGQFRPPRSKSTGVSFGKGFFRLKLGKRSSSAPELAQEECVIPVTEMDSSPSALSLPVGSQPPTPKPETKEKSKGLKKIFGKWKKSGPQGVEREENFKRGGIRATAGPRLGWSRDITSDPDLPFERWDTDMVAQWLHRMGLNMYVSECKRWVKNGDHLLKAKQHEIEKELGVKNNLHSKKLHLALKSFSVEGCALPKSVNNLDFQWVLRWLDDVGLPQYKDAFFDARVDGRMLHYLTVEDLLSLKVTNLLHHISIKRGIQVLRERNFDPLCLIRRSVPEESKVYTVNEVALWTNHRVMEWLRTVDLSEYAPNLRGSGVHGALMVYEDRFNANFLATLLNIPPAKTLLRRHLTTHFKEVVGVEVMQKKRECEAQNYTPLTPSTKVKAIRRGQFGLKKKRGKGELEYEDYVCPMDIAISGPDKEKTVLRRSSDPPSLSEPDSATVLQDKEALSTMASTNV